MRALKSIKWRLQIWYGLILVLVLAGFGLTAYQLEWGRQMRRVDDELHRRLATLANVLHQARPPERNRPPFGGPRDQRPDDLPPPPSPPDEPLNLPPWVADLFGTNQPENFYCVIQGRDGTEVARAGTVPSQLGAGEPDDGPGEMSPKNPPLNDGRDTRADRQVGPTTIHGEANGNRGPGPPETKPPPAWTRNGFREVVNRLPSGERILVGGSMAPELKELHRTAWQLALVGGIILFVGVAGGGWLVSRALRPIDHISAAAAKISAGDLSQRINVAETESELGRLAAVLNSTFARLDAAFAQQKQFASDAAHELRTPVAVILTQTQTALNRERNAAEYKETIEACQRAAQRMRKLISTLLELARFDAGQEPLHRLKFDLAQSIRDCVELLRPLAAERGIRMVADLQPLEITGDSERLAQVVTNLLTNAIQHNRPNGEVRLKLESSGGLAVLTVADNGPGISAEDLPNVFGRFYRGDKSRTEGGAGLGLTIARAIVEAHGGAIEAASRAAIGTTFTVRLPM